MFDFLHEQVAAIPDPVASTSTAAGGKAPAGGARGGAGGGGRKKKAAPSLSPEGSSGTSSSEDDDEDDDEERRRPPTPARKRGPPAKKAKVEIPSFASGSKPLIPSLPTAAGGGGGVVPSVFAPAPSLPVGGVGLPMYTPGLPLVPGPSYGAAPAAVKLEQRQAGGASESESGSSDDEDA